VSIKELEDEYAEAVHKLVKKKERKDEDVFELPEDDESADEADADVIDLVEVLKRSLQSGAPPKRAAKKGPARKRASRKVS
jgi:non-homologous end joining protein Ku